MKVVNANGLSPWADIERQIDLARDLRDIERIVTELDRIVMLNKVCKGSYVVGNKVAQYYIEMDAKLGEWVTKYIKRGGRKHEVTLRKLGISKKRAQRARQINRVPKTVRQGYYDDCNANEKDITKAGVISLAFVPKTSTPPMPDGKYSVILADPAWRYSRTPGKINPPEAHYQTMELQEICGMGEKVKKLAAPNCTLILWVPPCHLDHGIEVLKAWGFRFVTELVWDKGGKNMGQYCNLTHESILIGGKGSATPSVADKAIVQSIDSILRAPKTKKHSEKPALIYDVIEKLWPDGKYIELFARNKHSGRWTVWGNQAPKDVDLLAA
jgi:N6-adenosine-specific RNA methylase IME4